MDRLFYAIIGVGAGVIGTLVAVSFRSGYTSPVAVRLS